MQLISMRTTPVLILKRGTRNAECYISSGSSLFAKEPVCMYPERKRLILRFGQVRAQACDHDNISPFEV